MKAPFLKPVLILTGALAMMFASSCRNTVHGVVNDTQRNTRKVGHGVKHVGHKIGEGVETTGEKIRESTR